MVNVVLLPSFGSATQQHQNFLAVAGQIDTVAWAPVDLVFADSAKPFDIREVALLHSQLGDRYLGGSGGLQRGEPIRIGATPIGQQQFDDMACHG